MLKSKSGRYVRVLIPVAMSCLGGCTTTNYSYCPVYPVAGEKVAQELEQVSFDKAPYFWQWLGQIDKLREELEVCGE